MKLSLSAALPWSVRCNNDPARILVVTLKFNQVVQTCLSVLSRIVQIYDPGSVSRKYLCSSAVTKGMISPVWAHRSCWSSLLTVDCTRCQHTSRPGSVNRCNCLSYTLYDLLLPTTESGCFGSKRAYVCVHWCCSDISHPRMTRLVYLPGNLIIYSHL